MSFEKDMVLNNPDVKKMLSELFMNVMPRWGCCNTGLGNRWYAEYSFPPFWANHIATATGLATVQKTITERCQGILDNGLFDLEWIIIEFRKNGIYFEVPGVNGCYINPSDSRGYGEHNIDTPEQAFCLFLCLITALREIYQIISILIDDPKCLNEQELTYPTVTLKQNKSMKPLRPWTIKDDYETVAVIIAQTMEEASEIASAKGDYYGSDISYSSFYEHSKTMLTPLTLWYITVELDIDSQEPTKWEYKVVAGSKFRAIEIVENHFEENPPMFPILSITVGKEELFQPGIIDVTTLNPTGQT